MTESQSHTHSLRATAATAVSAASAPASRRHCALQPCPLVLPYRTTAISEIRMTRQAPRALCAIDRHGPSPDTEERPCCLRQCMRRQTMHWCSQSGRPWRFGWRLRSRHKLPWCVTPLRFPETHSFGSGKQQARERIAVVVATRAPLSLSICGVSCVVRCTHSHVCLQRRIRSHTQTIHVIRPS